MASTEDRRFDALAREDFETTCWRNPIFATSVGVHKYDHVLPDESRRHYLGEIRLAKDFLGRYRGIDGKRLSPDRAIDRDLAVHNLRLCLFRLERLRFWEMDPDAADTVGDAALLLAARDFAPFEERALSIARRLEGAGRLMRQVRRRVTRPVGLWAEVAAEACDGLPDFLLGVAEEAQRRRIHPPTLRRLLNAAGEASACAVEHSAYLRRDIIPKAREKWAIGRAKFAELVRLRGLGLGVGEIFALGQRYLRDTKRELVRLAGEITPGASVEQVIKHVRRVRGRPFERTLDMYRKAVERSREAVVRSEMATMPRREKIVVMETPDYLKPMLPFAAYFEPAKFDRERVGLYTVTPDPEGAEISHHSPADIVNTSVHEGYPGHHIQLTCALENPSLVRLMASAHETTEGWAHYCEDYMKGLGHDDSPESRFLLALDLAWRAARVIIDVRLSRGEMGFDEAVAFLATQAGMDRAAAVAEVKRYTMSPGYQLSYLLGKHKIKELKGDVRGELGERYSDRLFHDAILYSGSLPMKLMRRAVRNYLSTCVRTRRSRLPPV